MSRSTEPRAHTIPAFEHHEEHGSRRASPAGGPGDARLTLTPHPASRLFSIEPARCERVLSPLVHGDTWRAVGRPLAVRRVGDKSA